MSELERNAHFGAQTGGGELLPEHPHLPIIEFPVAGFFSAAGAGQGGKGGGLQHPALDAKAEHLGEEGRDAIRHDGRTTVYDLVQEQGAVPSGDRLGGSVAPELENVFAVALVPADELGRAIAAVEPVGGALSPRATAVMWPADPLPAEALGQLVGGLKTSAVVPTCVPNLPEAGVAEHC